jgi:putative oxidoreductase
MVRDAPVPCRPVIMGSVLVVPAPTAPPPITGIGDAANQGRSTLVSMHRYGLGVHPAGVNAYRHGHVSQPVMSFPMNMFRRFRDFPFVTLSTGVTLLRIVTALLFAAHAIVRIANGTIPQFGKFMEAVGFPAGAAWVWAITITEIVAALMLMTNRCVRPAATALFLIAVVGIILIHRHSGWFVGEHGTGGAEYSVALIMMLLVIAAADRQVRHQQ